MLICVDFNCHLELNCPDANELLSLADAAQLEILNTGVSFHKGWHQPWLDVVMIDHGSKVQSLSKSVVLFIDHHDSFLLQYKFATEPVITHQIFVRSFTDLNEQRFKTDIVCVRSYLFTTDRPVKF